MKLLLGSFITLALNSTKTMKEYWDHVVHPKIWI